MNSLMRKYNEIQRYSVMINNISIILGCNQAELAMALGVEHRMVWRWEGGECKPPQEVARKIEILSRNPEAIRSWLEALKTGVVAPAAPKSLEPPVPTPTATSATAAADAADTRQFDAFVAERCAVGEGQIVRFAVLWAAYLEWCAGNDVMPGTGRFGRRKFIDALDSRGILARNGTNNAAMRVGIALRPEFSRQEVDN